MAHYARNTPPVRPPRRPMMPDQPWTAWWEIDDPEPTAPHEGQTNLTDEMTAQQAAEPATSTVRMAEAAPAPDALEQGTDPYAFPHVDATSGGGLRRVGVDPTPTNLPNAPGANEADTAPTALPAAAPSNWGVLETAAAGATAPVGVQTVYGRFNVEGEARRAGDLVFTGVTFPDPVSVVPAIAAIELRIEQAVNVAADGVVIAGMGGFTPDRQGFTLITTALGPGSVLVRGQYVVEI